MRKALTAIGSEGFLFTNKVFRYSSGMLLADHLPDRMIVSICYIQGSLGIDIDARRGIKSRRCCDAIHISGCGRARNRSDYAILCDLPDLVVLGIGNIQGSIGRHTNGSRSVELCGSADTILRTLTGRVAGNGGDGAIRGDLPDSLA